MIIEANLVDVHERRIYPACIIIKDGYIHSITPTDKIYNTFILPGFIDAHVHIESSMLVPSEFARLAVTHGTVATVSDPHEIANVLGTAGVEYMLNNAAKVPFHFFFGCPSCVPATFFETAGAVMDEEQVKQLMQRPDIWYLSEMMNYPGVIHGDAKVLAKIAAAKHAGKPVDGHAPGLSGADLKTYQSAGITTDHECFTLEEALEKVALGMKILIREGSAAKNFEALKSLISSHAKNVMFCSDDKHPDDLLFGHINQLVERSVKDGFDVFDVLQAACVNPVEHYKLPVGLLREGDSADFIEVDDLSEFTILRTVIKGDEIFAQQQVRMHPVNVNIVNQFNCSTKHADDFKSVATGNTVHVIEALNGQLITRHATHSVKQGECFESDVAADVLKIAVVNRYADAPVAIGFIKNFGLQRGAIASCVAHDCHNIVAVGTNDADLCRAVNMIIMNKGGISLADGMEEYELPLPVAGIMSDKSGAEVADGYKLIHNQAKALGSKLDAPFMSLSFMALLVIPSLKLSDKGLFDGNTFSFTPVYS
jgi:adenine deaminase